MAGQDAWPALEGRLLGRAALTHMRRLNPKAVVYMPASGMTFGALLRGLVLSLVLGPRRLTFIVTQLHLSRLALSATRLLRLLGWAWVVSNAGQQAALRTRKIESTILAPRIAPSKVSTLDRAGARATLGLTDGRPVFLHVGHAREGRNLQSLASLGRDGTLVLVLSTAFPEDPGVVPEGKGVIVLRGYVDELAHYYRAADVYVFPTSDAASVIGLPMSIVEALANELPVVAVASPMVERWRGVQGVTLVDRPSDVAPAALRSVGQSVDKWLVPASTECAADLPTCRATS